jgi:hypothetical protein
MRLQLGALMHKNFSFGLGFIVLLLLLGPYLGSVSANGIGTAVTQGTVYVQVDADP